MGRNISQNQQPSNPITTPQPTDTIQPTETTNQFNNPDNKECNEPLARKSSINITNDSNIHNISTNNPINKDKKTSSKASKYLGIPLSESQKEAAIYMCKYGPKWGRKWWTQYITKNEIRVINPQWKAENPEEWNKINSDMSKLIYESESEADEEADLVSDIDAGIYQDEEIERMTEELLKDMCPECWDKNN